MFLLHGAANQYAHIRVVYFFLVEWMPRMKLSIMICILLIQVRRES
jgi:hypothetical protein